MKRILLKSKLHRLTVTDANLEYEGSITLDPVLMDLAQIMPYEKVDVWNVTNGQRISTYAIEGEAESGIVCINGAAAHLMTTDDIVIVASFAEYSENELASHEPRVVKVDQNNKPLR